MLEFFEDSHTYKLDGRAVPSVTQAIQAILPMRPMDDYYLQRGTAVHRACELYDRGTLDEASVDPEIAPRLEAWKKFRSDFGGEIAMNERRLASKKYQFAGTVDRVFAKGGKLILVDLKNGWYKQSILQIGGYGLLLAEDGRTPHRAGIVELLECGAYHCRWMERADLRRAEQQFLALLSVFGFAAENKLLKEQ